jgi:FKBP12-rapamycin complex-associated protein
MTENLKAEEKPAESMKLTVNQQHLKQAWDVGQVATKGEWAEWMHRLSVEFMRESPSHALRACMTLVDIHPPLAKELFNAAFISCWGELYDQYQEDLVKALETAMTSPDSPGDLVLRMLNLCEFMEHEEKPLPLENRMLGEYSARSNTWAKALHWRELEFLQDPSPVVIEALIGINTKLTQSDAAWGLLDVARDTYHIAGNEEWYEKLGGWRQALAEHTARLEMDPGATDALVGQLRCLHALGDWDTLASGVERTWHMLSQDERLELAPMAAAAGWCLNDWPVMKRYIDEIAENAADREFYNAIYQVHDNNFVKAQLCIANARDLLEPVLTARIEEGYGRSYLYVYAGPSRFVVAHWAAASWSAHRCSLSWRRSCSTDRVPISPSDKPPCGRLGLSGKSVTI